MNILRRSQSVQIIIIGCLVFITFVSASGGITAYLGDTIPLSGYSYGSTTVYLFLTGPNLPVNGVALNDVTARADQGHFTKVNVDSDDHWEYSWNTKAIRLDAGTYTLWVVDRPLDRSQLAKADYRTIPISLGKPVLKVDTPVVSGTLVLTTVPDGASVLIDNVYRGSTPLTLGALKPGTYRVTFSRSGYTILSTPVRVESGKTTEVSGVLIPSTGLLDITTSPTGAWILLDTNNQGVTPILITNITVGNHTLTAGKEGFVTAEQKVTVVENRTTQISITLVPASPSLPETAAPAPVTLIACFLLIFLVIRHMRRKY